MPVIYAQSTEVVVYLDSLRQVMSGFGAANILPWRPDMTAGQIQKAFGTGPGQLGFTLLRLRVPSSTNEFALNVSTAQAAYGMGAKIFASPWSPPALMKTNNNIVAGSLYDTSYASFASHLKSFADYMAGVGAPLYAISIQNEPDVTVTYESCNWNATQMLKFAKENAQTVGTKIILPESFHFDHALSDPTLNDSTAAAHVAIIGGHIYGGGLTSYPLAASKGKELWMTEHLDLDTTWTGVLGTGKEINDCMSADMNAYIWWYIVRYYGPVGEDGNVTKRGYVMSQYSRFVRPGYLRVLTTNLRGSVYVTAYKSGLSGNSKFVIVAVNIGSSAADRTFTMQNIAGGTATMKVYTTSKTKNCEQQTDIITSNGSFTATLPDSSVTTFVGDVVTNVDGNPETPRTFGLFQNYPNPFNPTTVISYQLPVASMVTLSVFDVLGREVTVLVNEEKPAGHYSVRFDGSGLRSGVYFYRLSADGFVATRKLVLVK
ncbi:MAG: T9SS type A sorting domain-containing protein [Bacteroidota bacterium]